MRLHIFLLELSLSKQQKYKQLPEGTSYEHLCFSLSVFYLFFLAALKIPFEIQNKPISPREIHNNANKRAKHTAFCKRKKKKKGMSENVSRNAKRVKLKAI